MKSLLPTRASAVGIALVAGLLLIATAQAARSSASASGARALVTLRKTGIGSVLADSRGRTLYLFEKDKSRKSMCAGSCATFWPPLLTTGKPRAGAGVRAKLLGTTTRAGGARQVTYAGHPLYTFKLERAGQTTGEGAMDFGPPFYAVSPAGAAVVK
jgi:predicted lipoprotein with Yx(FWY)xxD motif